jgi:hypothetical protein
MAQRLTPDRISLLKSALLAYVASFGVPTVQQRKVAAQLGRIMPHGLDVAASLRWLDTQVEHWAFALLGQKLSAQRVRAAFWQGGLDPLLLLRIPDGSAAFSALAKALQHGSRPAMPAKILTHMPVQSLARAKLAALFAAPVTAPAAQRV